MRRIISITITFILTIILSLTLFACRQSYEDDKLSEYNINLDINKDLSEIRFKQSINYYNNASAELKDITLNLHANAYQKDATHKAYTNPLSRYGGIEVVSAKVESDMVDGLLSESKVHYTLPIKNGVKSGQRINIELSGIVKIPIANLRFGIYKNTLNLGNFYPIVAVYENNKFRMDEFYTVGDPFYSEVANYNVTIVSDSRLKIAATGESLTKEDNNRKETTFSAKNVRDFAMVCGYNMQSKSSEVEGITVNYFHENDLAVDEKLKLIVDVMEKFNKAFGKYPYKSLNIVNTNFAYGGMEYPQLVMINNGERSYENVIIHEIAHQWWGCVVGSDSISVPWLDEGLTTFSEHYYHFLKGDQQKFDSLQSSENKYFQQYFRTHRISDHDYKANLDRTIYEFSTNIEYSAVAYTKANLMFNSVFKLAGQKKFEKALNDYYKENVFKNTTPDILYNTFSKVLKYDAKGHFKSWIEGDVLTSCYFETLNNYV